MKYVYLALFALGLFVVDPTPSLAQGACPGPTCRSASAAAAGAAAAAKLAEEKRAAQAKALEEQKKAQQAAAKAVKPSEAKTSQPNQDNNNSNPRVRYSPYSQCNNGLFKCSQDMYGVKHPPAALGIRG